MNVQETDKQSSNSELVKITAIEDSPFSIIGIEEEYFGAIANLRITEGYSSFEEAKEATEKMTWNRIVQVVLILIDKQTK